VTDNAASETGRLDYGGGSITSRAYRRSRKTIHKGAQELKEGTPLAGSPGTDSKSITSRDPEPVPTLEGLIDERAPSRPGSALR
jgi:hypothetical protein